MEKTMEEGTGLATRQKQFLAVVLQEPYLLKHFYLTGGTALASWYLCHRESYDLDFFSEVGEVNIYWLTRWLKKKQQALGYKRVEYTEQLGFYFFSFVYPQEDILKVDFSYFPSARIEKGLLWEGLSIDSLYDIAVNKFQTIAMSPRSKDYIDLYFILKKTKWSLERLRIDAAAKHGITTEITQIAKQLLRVVEFKDYPKMLVPFNKKEMEDFFLSLAKSLEKEIFRK